MRPQTDSRRGRQIERSGPSPARGSSSGFVRTALPLVWSARPAGGTTRAPQPKTAFSPFPLVHTANFEGQQCGQIVSSLPTPLPGSSSGSSPGERAAPIRARQLLESRRWPSKPRHSARAAAHRRPALGGTGINAVKCGFLAQASAQPSFQPKSAFAYFLFVQRPTRNVCTVSMAVDPDRLQWADTGRTSIARWTTAMR